MDTIEELLTAAVDDSWFQRFREQWLSERRNYVPLVRTKESLNDEAVIPEEAKLLLRHVGIPEKLWVYSSTHLQSRLPKLEDARRPIIGNSALARDDLYVLGIGKNSASAPADICIDCDGKIWVTVTSSEEMALAFFNSSLKQFLLCWLIYTQLMSDRELTESDVARRLSQSIRNIDNVVLECAPYSIWVNVLTDLPEVDDTGELLQFPAEELTPVLRASATEEQQTHLRNRWSYGELIRVPNESFADIPLPDETRRFLCNIGLPSITLFEFDFHFLKYGLRPLEDVLPIQRPKWTANHFFVLGTGDGGYEFCVTSEGHVVFIDRVNASTCVESLVNSSVEQFYVCLVEYFTLYYRNIAREVVHPFVIAKALKSQFRRVDPACLEDSEKCFWPKVLEQIRLGA